MNETVVVNRRREREDVYVGRGSVWGNPFSHRPGTQAAMVVPTVHEAIERQPGVPHRPAVPRAGPA